MNETYSLFLDDERYPPDASTDNWVICRSFDEAVEMFESCIPNRISFDHDLGAYTETRNGYPVWPKKTGYDFAKWLVGYDLDWDVLKKDFKFSVHSMNPIGANNITEYLYSYLEGKFGPRRDYSVWNT